MTAAELARLLVAAAAGVFPPPDGTVDVVAEPVGPAHAVVAFSAHFVVCAPVTGEWVAARAPADDFTATHSPAFLQALAVTLDADIGALDVVLAGTADQPAGPAVDADGPRSLDDLVEVEDRDHPRSRRAMRYRDDVRVWRTRDGEGHLFVGRGLVGRCEVAFEVDPAARGRGLGQRLATIGRRFGTADDPSFTQVSPGNVASLRAVLAAGYRPVCSEVLLPPGGGRSGSTDEPDAIGAARLRLSTRRLVVDAVAEDDLDRLTEVRRSNPRHLARTEGTAGQPGLFDRSKLERDLAVAAMDPAREVAAVRAGPGGAPIGLVEVLRRHPDDQRTWIGSLVLHGDHQRRGHGREVVEAVVDWARAHGTEPVRAAVDEDDEAARAFLAAMGFTEVERRWRRGPAGEVVVVVHERHDLEDPAG